MLADSVEASSRTLADPTPAKIQGLVQKMINKVFVSSELNECELTLKDLHQIAKSFTRVLTGIYHKRIEYSEPAEKRAKGTEAASSQLATESETDANTTETPEQKKPEQKKAEQKKTEPKKNGRRSAGETEGSETAKDSSAEKPANGSSKETLKRLGM